LWFIQSFLWVFKSLREIFCFDVLANLRVTAFARRLRLLPGSEGSSNRNLGLRSFRAHPRLKAGIPFGMLGGAKTSPGAEKKTANERHNLTPRRRDAEMKGRN
jgi:hypothetical protein